MNTPDIFPIRVYACDNGHYVSSPELAKSIWMRVKTEKDYWYAVDIEIRTPTTGILYVYDIGDSVYGGLGKRKKSIEIESFTAAEIVMVETHILNKQTNYAMAEFERREKEKERIKVLKIRKELFGV